MPTYHRIGSTFYAGAVVSFMVIAICDQVVIEGVPSFEYGKLVGKHCGKPRLCTLQVLNITGLQYQVVTHVSLSKVALRLILIYICILMTQLCCHYLPNPLQTLDYEYSGAVCMIVNYNNIPICRN